MMTRTEQRPNLLTASRRLLDLTVVLKSGSVSDMLPALPRRLEDVDTAVPCLPFAGSLLLIRMPGNQTKRFHALRQKPTLAIAADQGLISLRKT